MTADLGMGTAVPRPLDVGAQAAGITGPGAAGSRRQPEDHLADVVEHAGGHRHRAGVRIIRQGFGDHCNAQRMRLLVDAASVDD